MFILSYGIYFWLKKRKKEKIEEDKEERGGVEV